MHIKRFEGRSMPEALQQVRAEFGAEALVLSTRTVRRSGVFGRLAKPLVEVTAAVDRPPRAAPGLRSSDPSWRDLRLSRALIEPLEDEVRELRQELERLSASFPAGLSIAEEVGELRRLARNAAAAGAPDGAPVETGRYLAAGLAPRHAFSLGAAAAAARSGEGSAQPEALQAVLARRLDGRCRAARPDEGGILMLVGPTGVGKTTTLAKVAARERPHVKELALITTDAHRFGALAMLRSFATGLDLPFDVASSPEGLAERVRRRGRTRLFVDTAGRSRSDAGAVAELCRMRQALGRDARVHLVVSATTKEADLRGELRRYGALEPDALVLTKVDESDDLSSVVNLMLDEGTPPLTWLGDGQRIPEDLQVPDPEQLAAQVLGAAA